MPARNIKSYIAVVAAAAAVGLGAAAPASTPATGVHLTQLTPAMHDDPHTSFDDGAQPAILCATAIEYGLIAA